MAPSIQNTAFLPSCSTPHRRLLWHGRPELSRRRPRLTTVTSPPPLACTSLHNDAALKDAKAAYKAAKAEYKVLKAKYKILKEKYAEPKESLLKETNKKLVPLQAPSTPHSGDTVAVCSGKSCCRMGADAVAMLIGKNTARVPCLKMCGGVGPSVKHGDTVVKVDLKKAVKDAVSTSTEHRKSNNCESTFIEAVKTSPRVPRDKIAV